MRSELIYGAVSHTVNRFLLCRLVSLTTKRMHDGRRVPDSINEALLHLGNVPALDLADPEQDTQALVPPAPPAARPRARKAAEEYSAKDRAWDLLHRHVEPVVDAQMPVVLLTE